MLKEDLKIIFQEAIERSKSSVAFPSRILLNDAEKVGLHGLDSFFEKLNPAAIELLDQIWEVITKK